MSEGTAGTGIAPTKLRDLTPTQAVRLLEAIKRLGTEIDAVLPEDARIGGNVTVVPFAALDQLRFCSEEAALYLKNYVVK